MKAIAIVGIGGFIGSILRYTLTAFIQNRYFASFPSGTLFVNISGCLLIGLLIGYFERQSVSMEWRLLLITGLCGGFTTFSAFSVETIGLLKEGHLSQAIIYIFASVILGLLATIAGISVFKLS